jgi:hypothetical protein
MEPRTSQPDTSTWEKTGHLYLGPIQPAGGPLTKLDLGRTIPAYAPRSITRIQGTSTAILWTAVPISGTKRLPRHP